MKSPRLPASRLPVIDSCFSADAALIVYASIMSWRVKLCSGNNAGWPRPLDRVMACSMAAKASKLLTPQSLPPTIRAPASRSERAG